MRVRQLMTEDVITIGPEAPLKGAARRMIEAGVSGLPVIDDKGRLIGIITEADFVKTEASRGARRRAGLLRWFASDEGLPREERTVGDAMSAPVLTVGPDEEHTQAARLLMKNRVKRVPVVEEGQLIGLLSRVDLLRSFVRSDHEIIEEIKDDVMKRILWIEPDRVDVICVDGNVKLTGMLNTHSDAKLLATLTERLDGVASVDSRLTWELDNRRLETAGELNLPLVDKGH